MAEHFPKFPQVQAEREPEPGYPWYTEDGQPVFPEDELDLGSSEAEMRIRMLSDSLAEGGRPNKEHFAYGLRTAAAYGLALPANVLEHVADLLDHKVGHDKTKVCRLFPTVGQVFSKIEPQGPRCLRVAARYEELRTLRQSQKEALEILRDEYGEEFVIHHGKEEPGVSDRALLLDIQKGRKMLKERLTAKQKITT